MIKQPAAGRLRLRNLMEGPGLASPPSKDYVHYQHTDGCSLSRWTAKESYQFMYARPWQKVNDFYLDMVNGHRSLSELFGNEITSQTYAVHDGAETVEDCDKPELLSFPAEGRSGRWARLTFKILLSYHGSSFDGWQKQPGLSTVQGLIERSLGKFVDEKKAQQLKEKKLPIDGCAVAAGRTDKGVTALQQVCSFYTWRKDVKALDIKDAINSAAPGKIRVISVSQVSREFHPNFSAKWRRYFYIFPFNDDNMDDNASQCKKNVLDGAVYQDGQHGECFDEESCKSVINVDDQSELQTGNKPLSFEVSHVNHLLRQLEGKLLSFRMFARDTKASRNIGPPTECFVFHARAAEAYLPCAKDGTSTKTMCIELVANRFLRKMVRVLVATAIREAAAGADEGALIKLMDATCRRATAPPAPPEGLCLVDVGYTDFQRNFCLIP
ncbi:Pseudouridylate synthase [Handroanthus impetiginosus]|uniref:tRNA pseudouridine synthase n=1 Tax=Handroanthus impetiginosus TaxID=429701 RepID=A0A2G9G1E2_9LAMI|nr:Pseudouridylate synthase [Handroanthus impetiginosus]